MKKILMLIHTFPPIGSVGGSIRIIKFLKYMNELQSNIHSTIITLTDKKILLNDFHLAKASLSEIPKENLKLIRTNTFQPTHPNPEQYNSSNIDKEKNIDKNDNRLSLKKFIKKIYNILEKNVLVPDYGILWYPFSIKAALKEIRQNKIDIIYATAPPFSVLIQAVIIKKITKKKLVIDIKDDWVYQTFFLSRPIIIRAIERKLEAFCINNADKIILVTQKSFDDYAERYPLNKAKLELITNGCDVQEYSKLWELEKKRNHKFTVIHSGVLAVSRDPKGFFNAIVKLKENGIITKDNFEVKFIGILHAKIIKLIKELNLDDVIFTSGVLDRENYIKSISKADLLLAFNYQMKNLIPGKLYDYWGARNPILLIDSLDSMASKLVAENNLGTVNDFEDVEGMYNSIKSYFDAWYNNNPIPKSDIANLYNYDRKKLTGKLVEIFKSLEC